MPCCTVDFDIPFSFAKSIMLKWPNYSFFIEGFDLVSAEIVKEDSDTVYFFAKTIEFMFLPLFIAGKTTVLNKKILFSFYGQGKTFESYKEVVDKADISTYSFTYKFESNKLSIAANTNSMSDDKSMEKALKTVALGIEIQYYIDFADKLLTLQSDNFKKVFESTKTDKKQQSNLMTNNNTQYYEFNFLEQPENIVSAFKLLKLTPTKDIKKIKTTFRKLAREKHPDRIKDQKLKAYASREFIEISAAYKTILSWLSTN